ncbi:MAG: ERCC4 domain-containing protein [Candidatus Verstraetearchaeota archaeon]|nr:ERCC4 domain-containing protein [Candidatus Verstraetearchaeota archaeon]
MLKFLGTERDALEVVVDRREEGSQTVSELLQLGVKVEFKTLKVGDYVVSSEVAIERKTYQDLSASIVDKRLFAQAQALRECYQRPIIIIEDSNRTQTGVSREAIRGAIVSMVLDFGIPVINADGPEDAAWFILTIAKKEQRGGASRPALKDRRRPKTPDEEKEYIVASLPMIEATMARRLLREFGSVEAVFTASEEELQRVDKIGPKKAKRIREVISSRYTEECKK